MSSDSSEEENLELLKEAQDTQFINDSLFSDSPARSTRKPVDNRNQKVLPSLRRSKDDEGQFNFLKVTPEFRNYVAKQLASILDRKLNKKFADFEVPEIPNKKRKKGGIKLLSESKHFLKLKNNTEEEKIASDLHNSAAKTLKNNRKNNSEVSEELLEEVAVSPEDILSKKEIKNWSKRSKAPVFRYKKTKNGKLELVEPEFK